MRESYRVLKGVAPRGRQFYYIQKNPRVRKIFVRNCGAGNGRADLMGAWKNALFLQEDLHVHKIPPFRGGYLGFFWGGGVPIAFLFLWARGFF